MGTANCRTVVVELGLGLGSCHTETQEGTWNQRLQLFRVECSLELVHFPTQNRVVQKRPCLQPKLCEPLSQIWIVGA